MTALTHHSSFASSDREVTFPSRRGRGICINYIRKKKKISLVEMRQWWLIRFTVLPARTRVNVVTFCRPHLADPGPPRCPSLAGKQTWRPPARADDPGQYLLTRPREGECELARNSLAIGENGVIAANTRSPVFSEELVFSQ